MKLERNERKAEEKMKKFQITFQGGTGIHRAGL